MLKVSNLRKLRLERKLSLREVANMLNINFATLGKVELGERGLSTSSLELLADFYNVSTDYLLERTTERLVNKGMTKEQIEKIIYTSDFFDELDKEVIKAMKKLDLAQKEVILELMKNMSRDVSDVIDKNEHNEAI